MIHSQAAVYKYETHIVIFHTHMTAFWTDPLANSQSNHRVCVCVVYIIVF